MIHVFGPIFIDVIACANAFTPNSSCMASVRTSLGGVGYNLFRTLQHTPSRFVSSIGDGPLSQQAAKALSSLGPRAFVRTMPNQDIGLYVALMQQGNLLYGATDARTFETAMDQAFIEQAMQQVAPGDIIVADANLVTSSLAYLVNLANQNGNWFIFDPVSVDKSLRAKHAVRDMFLLTPTAEELTALLTTNSYRAAPDSAPPAPSVPDVPDMPHARDIHEWMRERRLQHLVVTLGHRGLYWFHNGKATRLQPTQTVHVKDTTGAGDTLLGSLVQSIHECIYQAPCPIQSTITQSTATQSTNYEHERDQVNAIICAQMPALLRQAMTHVQQYLISREAAVPEP